jgi:hypothetical protein
MNKGLPRRTVVLDPAAFAIGKKEVMVVDFVLDLQPKTLKLAANLFKEVAVTQLLWTFLQSSQEKAKVLQYARLVCLA